MLDDQLIRAYRAGDQQAATALFERYYQRLVELIRRQSGWRLKQAEGSMDVAQSVLRTFFDQVRNDRVAVGPDENLWPLLATITLNKVRNRGKFWQRARRDPTRVQPLDDGPDPLEAGPSPDDTVALADLVERLFGPVFPEPPFLADYRADPRGAAGQPDRRRGGDVRTDRVQHAASRRQDS